MNRQPIAEIEKWDVVLATPSASPSTTKEISEMLMYEELARARIQEMLEEARLRRMCNREWSVRRRHRIVPWGRRHRS
ncbi:MAG TPA: hypothetical protein VJT49_11475 [Amycolatopsis sp.]|uniref:hypothetical protein n=1 Tax=Amycolatopsis sp. TaxID=37632 RepID=UPI002B45D980|nr:hypothetical protein [Amycolatopsis sp.]HKS45711.1 hypothetical protein [Amycolatopsis sp.]